MIVVYRLQAPFWRPCGALAPVGIRYPILRIVESPDRRNEAARPIFINDFDFGRCDHIAAISCEG